MNQENGRPLPSQPFTLGVASGDTTHRAIALWTRLAPDPKRDGGGMPAEPVEVSWVLAEDGALNRPVRFGSSIASPELAHSVHITVNDLEPGRNYYYQFEAAGHASPVGRTRTLPDPEQPLERVRFATVCCQHYEAGTFAAYRDLVRQNVDFVLHLGDYIYEVSRHNDSSPRQHDPPGPPIGLNALRLRHAQYKQDPDLQTAHRHFPFFTLLDNHDALEDVPNDFPEALQRAAAYQAWFEHMPLRERNDVEAQRLSLTRGTESPAFSQPEIYLGDLCSIFLTDSRHHRSPQEICDGPEDNYDSDFGFGIYRPACDERSRQGRTLLGEEQLKRLEESLKQDTRVFSVLASSVLFSPFSLQSPLQTETSQGRELIYEGSWDAYPDDRGRVLQAWSSPGPRGRKNRVILSGDLHSHWAIETPAPPLGDSADAHNGPRSRRATSRGQPIAVEFLTSSLTSDWPAPLDQPIVENLKRNPHVRSYNGAWRGYQIHDLTHHRWSTAFRVLRGLKSGREEVATALTATLIPSRSGIAELLPQPLSWQRLE